MNHVKIFKGWPLQDAPSKLDNCGTNYFNEADFCLAGINKPIASKMPLRSWYNCGTNYFNEADFCLAGINKPIVLSNKCSTA